MLFDMVIAVHFVNTHIHYRHNCARAALDGVAVAPAQPQQCRTFFADCPSRRVEVEAQQEMKDDLIELDAAAEQYGTSRRTLQRAWRNKDLEVYKRHGDKKRYVKGKDLERLFALKPVPA
jgi:hypothetical protein